MIVARDRLLAVLEAASPALGTTRNLVAGLSYLWFDRETVTAFNDVLGIRVIFPSDFEGGVVGERLLGIIKNSTAENVVLGARAKVLKVTLGSTDVSLPMRPVTESLFREQFPHEPELVYTVSDKFIESLKLVMLSCVSKKLASSVERGVTLIQEGTTTDLFTTDDLTVSWARVKGRPLLLSSGRVIWSREFCDYFVKHFRDGTHVVITDDAVWCTGGVPHRSGPLEVTLHAKLIEGGGTSDFGAFVRSYEGARALAFKIPPELPQAVARAVAMVPEKTPIELEVVTVDRGLQALRLYANTAAGEFDDLMKIDANGHADLTVKANAALIKRALPGRTALALARGGVVLAGPPGFFHFISLRR